MGSEELSGHRRQCTARAAFRAALLAAVCLGACAPPPAPAEAAPAAAVPAAAAPAASKPGKVQGPVEVTCTLERIEMLAAGGAAEWAVRANSLNGVKSAAVRVELPPGIAIEPRSAADLGAIAAGGHAEFRAALRPPAPGRYELRAWVEGLDRNGAPYGASRPLFVIVHPGRVLAGQSSFIALDLEDLEARRAAGALSETEYDAARNALLSAPGEESIRVTTPRP